MPEIAATNSPTQPTAEPSIQEQTEGASAPARAKPADATRPEIELAGKYVKIEAPLTYDEVLMIIPQKLPCNENIGCFYHVFEFFVDVVDSYIPAMLEDMRGYCTGEDNRDALAEGDGAVMRLRRIIRELRELLAAPEDFGEGKTGWEKFNAAQSKWKQLLQAFAQAHDEEFCTLGSIFSDEFKKWKQGETDLRP
jgi:hypothetical protein